MSTTADESQEDQELILSIRPNVLKWIIEKAKVNKRFSKSHTTFNNAYD
jgi:hypothetical protein